MIDGSFTDHTITVLGFESEFQIPNHSVTTKHINYEAICSTLSNIQLNGLEYHDLIENIRTTVDNNTLVSTVNFNRRKKYLKPYI